ncbi:hypothetical protein GQR58_010804 [Nymphon striatum]|nr:hypothetical protein GQR58_010804 [Nymphon striatum]
MDEESHKEWKPEEFTEWNPWGKPGAGAPLENFSESTGDLIHFRRQSPSWSHTDCDGSRFGTPTSAVARVLPQKITKSAPPIKYVPMAIASSVPLGDNDEAAKLEVYKQEEKKRWLLELELQREEQRLRKRNEKILGRSSPIASNVDFDKKLCITDTEVLHLKNNYELATESLKSSRTISSPVPENHMKKLQLSYNFISDLDISSSSNENLTPYVDRNNLSSSFSNNYHSPNQEKGLLLNSSGSSSEGNLESALNKNSQRSFLRGHNIPIDESSKLEFEEKKLKALKLQQDIKAQVEEKARLKHEEKLRLQREEIEDEKRFCEQQEYFQRQFELEQQRIKDKEVAEEEKRMKIVAEIEKAQKEAEKEKISRRKCQTPMESGVITYNHSPSPLPEPEPVKHSEISKTPEVPLNLAKHEVSTSMENAFIDDVTDYPKVYTTNRILTPSVYRQANYKNNNHTLSREFGTQTDVTVLKEMDKNLNFRRHKPSRQTVKADKTVSNVNSGKICENDRPKWGINKPRATYLKQSERDPYYERRQNSIREKRKPKSKVPADSDSSTTPTTPTSSEARKKWSDQESYDLSMSLSPDLRSNVTKEDEEPKTKSADSGYEERSLPIIQMQSDVLNANKYNPTSPIIRSNVLLNQHNPRQDRILQQLSDLRQGLLLKQIELQKLISATKSN